MEALLNLKILAEVLAQTKMNVKEAVIDKIHFLLIVKDYWTGSIYNGVEGTMCEVWQT